MSDSGQGRRRQGRWAALAAATALAAAGVAVMLPGVSAAAEIDAIKSIEIVGDPDVPLVEQQRFKVQAEWELPQSPQPQAGDTITLNFPQPAMAGWAATFELEDTDGSVVGTCEVVVEKITCTLNEYVETHSDISGVLWFEAQARQSTEEDTLILTAGNGVTMPLPLPGGGIVPRNDPPPTNLQKWGWVAQDGKTFEWRIFIPAQLLQPGVDGLPVEVKDTLDIALTRTGLQIAHTEVWNNGDYYDSATWLDATQYNRTDVGNVMTLTFNQPLKTTGIYAIQYSSPVPAGTEPGDVFSNEVEIKDVVTRTADVEVADAGGSASGKVKKSISIAKQVTGAAPADFSFVFQVSCTKDGSTNYDQSGQVLAGDTVTFPRIPIGSVCQITETASGGAALTLQPAGPITVGEQSPAVIEVVAVNDFTVSSEFSPTSPTSPSGTTSPSSPSPSSLTSPSEPTVSVESTTRSSSSSGSSSSSSGSPTTVVVSSTTGTTPQPTRVTTTAPPRGPLPNTGVSVGPLLLGGAALILGGLVLSIARGRRAEHS